MIDKLFVLLNDITDKEKGDLIDKIGVEDNESIKKGLNAVLRVLRNLLLGWK